MKHLPKLRLQRTRTCSSDSGCDVVCDSPDLSTTMIEEAVIAWQSRMEDVVRQEVERAKEITARAKEDLRQLEKGTSAEGTVTLAQKTVVDCLYIESG